MSEGAAGPVVPYQPSPFDDYLAKIRAEQTPGKPLTIDRCIEILDSPEFKDGIEGETPVDKLASIVRLGAEGDAKETAQQIADLVCRSKILLEARPETKATLMAHTTAAGKAWAAIKEWVSGVVRQFCQKYKKWKLEQRLLDYTTQALEKTLTAGSYTPSSLAINFGVNFLKAVKNDPDIKKAQDDFLKFFLEQLKKNAKKFADLAKDASVPTSES
jgi:hypothetical protein